jgi:hypothetical protein
VHPLLIYDPRALDYIDLISLEYFESDNTTVRLHTSSNSTKYSTYVHNNNIQAPVPRNQDLPERAKTKLTGKCILVATSHAWFFQSHPDPEGVKLNLIKNMFAPQLRKRYPYTKIVLFDDWHSCPQWPRETEAEEIRFRKAMEYMNSMYVYCDVVLFLEVPLPDLDTTVRTCTIVPSEQNWSFFIDVVQFQSSSTPSSSHLQIQHNDIITSIDKDLNPTVAKLASLKTPTLISFLRRPFGRPNQTPPHQRGWLYAERITIAIKTAASPPSQFDNVVISNNSDLRMQIFRWSDELRDAAKLEKFKPGSIAEVLEDFKRLLATKTFTWPGNDTLVIKIIEDLVKKFKLNWEEESKRQSSMGQRARELLLSWGQFSNQYVERAFRQDANDGVSIVLQLLGVVIVGPVIAMIPFLFEITETPEDDVFLIALFANLTSSFMCQVCVTVFRHSFGSVPMFSFHNFIAWTHKLVIGTIVTITLRLTLGLYILPLDFVCGVISFLFVAMPIENTFFRWITLIDPRSEKKVYFTWGQYCECPRHLLFDAKTRESIDRVSSTTNLTMVFGLAYPLLAGVFFRSSTVVQCTLVLLFFFMRAFYEYTLDSITCPRFGSDGMPNIMFSCVALHEICLSIMLYVLFSSFFFFYFHPLTQPHAHTHTQN